MWTVALLSMILSVSPAELQGARSSVEVSLWLDGTQRAAMVPFHEPYSGAPSIGAPARSLRSNTRPRADRFIVRSWIEGDQVRILVFARDRDKKETHIASALLKSGESWLVTQTEEYGAVPVTVLVSERQPH